MPAAVSYTLRPHIMVAIRRALSRQVAQSKPYLKKLASQFKSGANAYGIHKMRFSTSRYAAVAVSLLFGNLSLAQQPLQDSAAINIQAKAVEECFDSGLKKRIAGDPTLQVRPSADQAIFVAEQISKDLTFDDQTRRWRGAMFSEPVEQYCSRLVDTYIRVGKVAVNERAKNKDKSLAGLGSASIISDSAVVQTYQNLHGRHYKGTPI